MRKAKGKKFGYIIIPIVVAPGTNPIEALNDNFTFKVVWQVLNALKSHDDRFNSKINQIRFNDNISTDGGSVLIGCPFTKKKDNEEVININEIRHPLFDSMAIGEYTPAIYAKLVKKVGSLGDMIAWASDVGEVAKGYIERFKNLVKTPGKPKQEFQKFLSDLQKNINPSVDEDVAISMLAQHMVTRPVFEALFENYSFAKNNPVSKSLQKIINTLEKYAPENDSITYGRFQDKNKESIVLNRRTIGEFVRGIDNAKGRQKIIVDLYNNFFKIAFKEEVEKLGIVYTPVEVVDFIIHSVAKVLKKEFDRDISDKNIHILDPFTGTGTFITRLIESGLLDKNLEKKYLNEIHANEIVLLAYYISSINIENAYHDAIGEKSEYLPFEGVCLTDSFQMYEEDEGIKPDNILKLNSERTNIQKDVPIMVIIGNPPYSRKQKAANDNAQNIKYKNLEDKIAETYAYNSTATLKNPLYDSYIKAFKWASLRIKENGNNSGIIGFVTNAGFLDAQAMDGMRKCLSEEFSSIYVFNLRGNQRTSGELSKKEGGKIFGSGSRAPIAITILVKKQNHKGDADIFYSDIGDYLSREDKLMKIFKYHDIFNPEISWEKIVQNEAGDWLNQRSDLFEIFIPIGDKKNPNNKYTFFIKNYSNGLKTNRDAWCYNFSKKFLIEYLKKSISFYNEQVESYISKVKKNPSLRADDYVIRDSKLFSWSSNQLLNVNKGKKYIFDKSSIIESIYRPFTKEYCYFNRNLNERIGQLPQLFPTQNHQNLVICISAFHNSLPLISNYLPDIHFNGDSQCFPLHYYEKIDNNNSLFKNSEEIEGYVRKDGVTDYILKECNSKYSSKNSKISKSQIFYYVYGILHSPDYLEAFSADLKKMLPRIPLVKKAEDFEDFYNAGKTLAKLHLEYEIIKPYSKVKIFGEETNNFKVHKMRFGKGNINEEDKTTIIYNNHITIKGIPLEAYDYIINGKSAIEWIMERYQIKADTKTEITNDPNDWAKEHDEPRYVLDLLLKIIKVSVETVKIVNVLPKLEF
jgi:predicted helicase